MFVFLFFLLNSGPAGPAGGDGFNNTSGGTELASAVLVNIAGELEVYFGGEEKKLKIPPE